MLMAAKLIGAGLATIALGALGLTLLLPLAQFLDILIITHVNQYIHIALLKVDLLLLWPAWTLS